MRALAGSLAAAALLAACSSPEEAPVELVWTEQASGVEHSLRGLSVVDADTAWVGTQDGTVLLTVDGGANWAQFRIAEAGTMDLRSAHGFDGQSALFITAGHPAQLFRTDDGGASFDLVYQDPSDQAFYDTLAFWNAHDGIAFSDPVDGAFRILLTHDGGTSWQAASGLPEPLDGEAGFAASNTMIALAGDNMAWIGTGGGDRARVLHTANAGESWSVHDTPMASGAGGAGIFSVAVMDGQIVIVGGNYTEADIVDGTSAWSKDDGTTWHVPSETASGYRSAVAAIPGHAGHFVAVGPNGTDLTRDGGMSWVRISETGFHAIAFAPDGSAGWAVGSDGRISRVEVAEN